MEAACKFLCLLVISPSEANRDGWISVRCCRQKCCKRPTCSIDSELSRDLWLPAHLSSLALCITYGGYWNLSVFNLFLHGLGFRGSLSALPSSGLIGPPVPQQLTNPGLSCAILYRILYCSWHGISFLIWSVC